MSERVSESTRLFFFKTYHDIHRYPSIDQRQSYKGVAISSGEMERRELSPREGQQLRTVRNQEMNLFRTKLDIV